MFKLKNAALATAIVLALAACGGGSDDPVDQGPGNGGAVDNPQGTDNPGTDNPGTDNPGTDNPGDNNDPGATPDAVFTGNMTLAANQVLFNGMGIDYDTFNTSGAYGFARGDQAPLQSFGLRVFQEGMMGQSDTVRIALELDDAESDTLIQMLVDRATLTISETGALSITVPDEAQAHVVARNAAGTSASASSGDIATDVIRFTPIEDDPTSLGLTIDINAIMAAAIAAASEGDRALLTSMRDVEGRFNMRVALSGVELRNPAGNTLTLNEPITVGSQAPVSGGSDAANPNGSGVSGILYIGVVPPGA